jgi:hypothetical protein
MSGCCGLVSTHLLLSLGVKAGLVLKDLSGNWKLNTLDHQYFWTRQLFEVVPRLDEDQVVRNDPFGTGYSQIACIGLVSTVSPGSYHIFWY